MVADLIAVPRDLLDAVKAVACKSTGIPTERMLISATHTHSAPSVIGALGSDRDEAYTKFVPPLLAKAIEQANANLVPAKVGWAVAKDFEHTNCRRWIYRSDRVRSDPFGERTVHAMMHPGYQNPSCVGPAGPIDPDITMVSVKRADGRPLALLANYSMHYYGAPAVSSDYYGPFCSAFARLIGAEKLDPPFVAIMSHGTSGDMHWMDYGKPRKSWGGRAQYADLVARVALEAYKGIEYHDRVPIRMAERKITLRRRVPDGKRLAWAKAIMAKMGNRKPRSRPEVYAREQIFLHNDPTAELKLQALRIGDMGITAIPNEVYGLTGLKIKAHSPMSPTMNIELANGCEGYIPPPEQHKLGGYNAWPARSAGLEEQAEPKIVETVLRLLEDVSGKRRRTPTVAHGTYAKAVLAAKPLAYWRLKEFAGPRAVDASGHGCDAMYQDMVAFHLEGPPSNCFCGRDQINRAAHFAGGRMKSTLKGLGSSYSVELWFWNGFPANARAVTGYVFSRGRDGDRACPGDHLGIGGKTSEPGKLFFFNGNAANEAASGSATVSFKAWNHVVFVRDGAKVALYLNGSRTAEIATEVTPTCPKGCNDVFVGGRCDNVCNFEGKISEAAIYGRVLTADEVAAHFAAAGMKL